MKKVLVIKGRSAYNVLRKAADEIAEGFRAYGCETEVLDTQAEDFLVRLSGCLEQREQYAFCFSLQAIGWEQECTALPQLRDMRRVGWLVDDPFFHEARHWQRWNGSVCPDGTGCVYTADQRDVSQV